MPFLPLLQDRLGTQALARARALWAAQARAMVAAQARAMVAALWQLRRGPEHYDQHRPRPQQHC